MQVLVGSRTTDNIYHFIYFSNSIINGGTLLMVSDALSTFLWVQALIDTHDVEEVLQKLWNLHVMCMTITTRQH